MNIDENIYIKNTKHDICNITIFNYLSFQM